MSDALVQRSGRGLSPLTTSRWPGVEGVPATRLWPGGAVPCGTATSRGVPLPPPRQCGLSSPTRTIMHGGHSTAPGPPPRRLPAKHGADEEVWTSVQLVQPCTLQGAPPTKEHTTQGGYLARDGDPIPTSSRDLPAGCVLGGCSLPQGLPRYSDAVAPPNRSTSRGGERFRAPRPWVSALSAAATHPQTVQVGPSNAPDHPTEGLDRGGYAAAASQRPTHRPLALTSCSASRSRGATQRTKPARAAPKKQPDLARNSGARCLPNTPQNGGCRVRPFPLPFSLILSLSFSLSLSLVSLPLSFSQ